MKPQDIVLALKIALTSDQLTVKELSESLFLSQGEVINGFKRLQASGLLLKDRFSRQIIRANLVEFITHGLKYVFPGALGAPARGMMTAWGHPRIADSITSQSVPVWTTLDGKTYGPSLKPLYKEVPKICSQDLVLYEIFALIDCLRIGRAREISLARKRIAEMLASPKDSK